MSFALPDYSVGTLPLLEPSPRLWNLRFAWGSEVNLNCIVHSETLFSCQTGVHHKANGYTVEDSEPQNLHGERCLCNFLDRGFINF